MTRQETTRFGSGCCSVVELRQYVLHTELRDALVSLFDTELLEPQEATGAHVVGQFRDADRASLFVWLRGFVDMSARARALEAFYYGPVWREHREAANATMVDSDDVLLLTPAWPGAGLAHPPPPRPADGATENDAAVAHHIRVHQLREPPSRELLALASGPASAAMRDAGLTPLAWYVTEGAPNTFPALPVREGEHVLVSLAANSGKVDPPPVLPEIAACMTAAAHDIAALPTQRSQLR